MISNIHVVMKNINKSTRMFMHFVLRWTAQIPGGEAQNQAQNGLKRTCIGRQVICSMWRQQLKSHWKKPKTELKVSSNTDVVMKNTNKGTHMFTYVFLCMGKLKFQWGKLNMSSHEHV